MRFLIQPAKRRLSWLYSCLLLGLAPVAANSQSNAPGLDFFESKVRPILVGECYSCHSAKSKPLMGGLRLDSRPALFKGGMRGSPISTRNPDGSLFLKAISYADPDLKMPPKGKLSSDKLAVFAAWIKQGAPYPEDPKAPAASPKKPAFDFAARARHWSFQPLKKPSLPAVKNAIWVRTSVDRFILAKLEAAGLKPAPPADRRTLLRRLTFDLIGLPPTSNEIKAFLADRSPNAYRTVVDRLLASPHYGERWARHWLDLVRFAETDGHEFDVDKPAAFEYRDYVNRAFNADLPFDQFVREHVSGDLIPHPRYNPVEEFNESIIATGFWFLGEADHSPVDLLENEAGRVDNQIDVFGRAFLGLSVGCARCHDHKFDPIPTKDYYALSGYMKSSRYQLAAIDPPGLNAEPIRKLTEIDLRLVKEAIPTEAARIRSRLQIMPEYLLAASAALRSTASTAFTTSMTNHQLKSGALSAWSRYLTDVAAKDPADPFYPWISLTSEGSTVAAVGFMRAKSVLLRRLRDQEEIARGEESNEIRFEDFRKPDYSNWFVAGEAFGAAPAAHAIRFGRLSGLEALESVSSAPAADSGLLSDKLQGALRSSTFTIVKPRVIYRMSGNGCQVRLIVDNFQRIRDPIYGGLEINVNTGDRTTVFTQDVSKWVGHRAYVEILDSGAGHISVQRISFADHAPSTAPNPAILKLLESPDLNSQESLARGYAEMFSQAAGRLADARALSASAADPMLALADWALKHDSLLQPGQGFTPASLEENPNTRRSIDIRAGAESAIKPTRRVMAIVDGTGENDRVHVRGNPKVLTDLITRRFLQICGGATMPVLLPGAGSGRLALAERMTGPNDPLLPRVIVNRVWQHHFGEGLVRTPDDFGLRGEKPTHRELLEWLASEFVKPTMDDGRWTIETRCDSSRVTHHASRITPPSSIVHRPSSSNPTPWSLKRLHRLIVLSNAYQMSSLPQPEGEKRDPQNRLNHRANVRRLEAEAIRDSILAVSGRLDNKMFGPSVMPFLTPFMEGRGKPAASGPLDGDGRRSIYLSVRRNFLNPMFLAFDYPVPFNCMGRRSVSNVPAQALTMLNNPLLVEQASVWSKRVLAEPGLDAGQRVGVMYEAGFGRQPTTKERADALSFLFEQDKRYGNFNDPRSWADLCHVLYNVKEFIFVN